ncbi:DUF5123 domain-containing protein [Bacteroides sp. UBA939]|uniref:DUF5123 domain-containing protein n=1 Tax=Bacteroides sp. UBA939 TaxID=1946092 RepID=UPI0025BFCD21|nr:DUF5123 domain-containing protein [Bacteroides sp. UBA939]
MKIKHIYTLILCAILSVCTISCDEDVNNWPIDPSYEAPFRSTGFSRSRLGATTIELNYKGVTDAVKYTFEFSEGDSLLFNNIVRTVDILADTLTVYNDNVAPTKREYRTIFEDLKGTTRYSVRMKATDVNNKETGYVQLSFDTPAEQVVYRSIATTNSITLYWDVQRPINKILYGVRPQNVEGEEVAETVFEERPLTSEEQSAGFATLTGLDAGTMYDIRVMLDDQLRGSLSISTTGMRYYERIIVDPAATGSSINELLTEKAGQKIKDILLIFPVLPGDTRYEIGQINVPKGIDNLYFTGASITTELPKLFLHAVRLDSIVQNIKFQNISIDGDRNGSAYFFNIDNADRHFKNVSFTGCEIMEINRSLVRLSAAIEVNSFIVDNCVIFNVAVGGYGFYNTGNGDLRLKLLSITNSTMREIGDQLGDIQGIHDMVIMDHVTFCNYTTGLPKLIRWRNAPVSMQMTNNIFTGTNNDAALEAIYNNTYQMDFTSCYKTNEWTWKSYPFTNITEVDMSGEDLFVDPRNGDFHLKEGARFAGANSAGDPRWWTLD